MENILNNKKIIIICFFLVLIAFLIYYRFSSDKFSDEVIEKEENNFSMKHYDANEYLPVYMTDESVIKIYLNDFKNNMINNSQMAYDSLNEKYRELKFGSLDRFNEYIVNNLSLEFINSQLSKYSIGNIDGKKVFYVYDDAENFYIFVENSIMDYEVYLDAYTVELD